VDKNDDVWVLNRPNDLTDIELHAELTPHGCRLLRAASIDDPHRQERERDRLVRRASGHGMDVDSQGFVYIGQDTVRKYDPKTAR
jgi:hypothetical protein